MNVRLAFLMTLAAAPALAVDAFEIQIYDGSADAPGQAGLEVHLNQPKGGPLHFTLEPSYGITEFWELGGYFQTADGKYEGVKLRSKFVTPESFSTSFRLGLNFELSRIPNEGWGGEIRPILAFENERFLVAVNPIVSFPAAFEPGAMAKVKFWVMGAGLEYYWAPADSQQYLYETVDLFGVKDVEVNLALGQGLTSESQSLIFKMILGYAF
ncbi:MAG TPA: hypothetical protein VEP66_16010 [Myxococcales bacterium]|nr:hypothetical protein [Myxococcales bacterium]